MQHTSAPLLLWDASTSEIPENSSIHCEKALTLSHWEHYFYVLETRKTITQFLGWWDLKKRQLQALALSLRPLKEEMEEKRMCF